jgi:ribosome-associated heat shock protein Hsp15
VKHRSLASELIEGGHVRVNSVRVIKISHVVKVGDVLTIALNNQVKVVQVLGEAEKRGAASVAAKLYTELGEAPPQSFGQLPHKGGA